jgi:hypothetical protein
MSWILNRFLGTPFNHPFSVRACARRITSGRFVSHRERTSTFAYGVVSVMAVRVVGCFFIRRL